MSEDSGICPIRYTLDITCMVDLMTILFCCDWDIPHTLTLRTTLFSEIVLNIEWTISSPRFYANVLQFHRSCPQTISSSGHRGQKLDLGLYCYSVADLFWHTDNEVNRENAWWRHEMETFCALPALCEGNSQLTGEFPSKRPVTLGFDVSFDLSPKKRLNKQSRRRWFETSSYPLWRHRNGNRKIVHFIITLNGLTLTLLTLDPCI